MKYISIKMTSLEWAMLALELFGELPEGATTEKFMSCLREGIKASSDDELALPPHVEITDGLD